MLQIRFSKFLRFGFQKIEEKIENYELECLFFFVFGKLIAMCMFVNNSSK